MGTPDPGHMIDYCHEVLPGMLSEACDVDAELAKRIGEDVLTRAEAFAAVSPREQNVLIAPFVEEAFDHRPAGSSLALKAQVVVVVRNSLLEAAHFDGPLGSGIIPITECAAGPLSHFLAARRAEPIPYAGRNPFADLPVRYPRAWACLSALTDVFAEGGRKAWKPPAAPVPPLPSDAEVIWSAVSDRDAAMTIFSAIDERFDQRTYSQLQEAMSGDVVLCVSALSRYSRNSAKLHRILEFLLAHNAILLTSNYLIRASDVWVRRGELVKPVSADPYAGLAQTSGLSGAHRKLAESAVARLRQMSSA